MVRKSFGSNLRYYIQYLLPPFPKDLVIMLGTNIERGTKVLVRNNWEDQCDEISARFDELCHLSSPIGPLSRRDGDEKPMNMFPVSSWDTYHLSPPHDWRSACEVTADVRVVVDEIIRRCFFRRKKVNYIKLNLDVSRDTCGLQIAVGYTEVRLGEKRRSQSHLTNLRAASIAEDETSVPCVSRPRVEAIARASYP